MGNLLRLEHRNGNGTSGFTRELTLETANNRLRHVQIGQAGYDYRFDANGNMRSEATSRHFEWNHSDQMRAFRTQTEGAEPSVHAHYLYDAAGQRVKKLVRKQGGQVEVTHYIDGVFEHHRWGSGAQAAENNHVHVMDDTQRIALVRLGPVHPEDRGPAMQFHLGDHLASGNVAVDESGALTNREEFTPYGETSFGSFARKRYRFTGMERDEESGLNYHGARYYAPGLGRWASCDPIGMGDGLNLYVYCNGNPINRTDKLGSESEWCPFYVLCNPFADDVEVAPVEFAVKVTAGAVETGLDTVIGIVDLVTTDPRQTASGIWSAVTHPEAIASAIWNKAKAIARGDDPQDLGNVIAGVAETVVPVTKLAKVSKAAKVADTGADIAKVTDKAADVAKTTTAVKVATTKAKAAAKHLDNNMLSALKNPKDAHHAKAVAYATSNKGTLYANRAAYMEFLGKSSHYDFTLLAKKYGLKLRRDIDIETLASTATRLEKAFAGTLKGISRTDAMNAAGALLRKETLVTTDLRLFKRAKDLSLKVEYTGSETAKAAAHVAQPVVIPVK